MNGQALFIDHGSRTVIAKLSTHPGCLEEALVNLQDEGMLQLSRALLGSPGQQS